MTCHFFYLAPFGYYKGLDHKLLVWLYMSAYYFPHTTPLCLSLLSVTCNRPRQDVISGPS